MNDPIYTEDYHSYIINIYCDLDPENPREWDNFGTMVCKHRRYTLGDIQISGDTIDWLANKLNIDDLDEWVNKHVSDAPAVYCNEVLYALIAEIEKDNILLPLYIYDHSGITMNTTGFSCPWDSSQVGFIYVSKDEICKEFGWKYLTKKRINRAKEILRNEVNTYDQYIRGDVYGYTIIDPSGNLFDSCWGFYPNDKDVEVYKHALEQARDIVDVDIGK